jgi:hypothetical protein
MNLEILAPSFCCAAKFCGFPAQSERRVDLAGGYRKRSGRELLWIGVDAVEILATGIGSKKIEGAGTLRFSRPRSIAPRSF